MYWNIRVRVEKIPAVTSKLYFMQHPFKNSYNIKTKLPQHHEMLQHHIITTATYAGAPAELS